MDVWWWTWGPDSPQSLTWGGWVAGRKSKLTPERVKVLCAAIERGATYEHAAAAAGIARDTLHEWRIKNPAFADTLKEAEARGVLALLDNIQAAAKDGQWQASAWILERRYPADYGKQIVQHEGGQTLTVRYENDWRAPTIDTEAQ